MKKILIIEDDENKREQLAQFIKESYPQFHILIAKSYHSGLELIINGNNNIALLDMTMPTYDIGKKEDGGRPQHYAGREILRQMDRRKILTPIIVITQFDVFGEGSETLTRAQLDEQLQKDHPNTYQGMIYYNAAMDDWKMSLKRVLDLLSKRHDK